MIDTKMIQKIGIGIAMLIFVIGMALATYKNVYYELNPVNESEIMFGIEESCHMNVGEPELYHNNEKEIRYFCKVGDVTAVIIWDKEHNNLYGYDLET